MLNTLMLTLILTFNTPLLRVGASLRAGLCCVLCGVEGVVVGGDWTPGMARCLGDTLQTLFQVGQSKKGWYQECAKSSPGSSVNPHLYSTTNLQQLLILMEEARREL